ncbi:hypothetical protein [Paraliobacillus ryukyuensis]|uniref:hypothetical protein n=1 Tax=Paraliobacillus ryukyuensis TaxID=200904 RepID=UPI0015C40FF7|nr:hypothetical protein [Paraliobacillus ryukyuensis]
MSLCVYKFSDPSILEDGKAELLKRLNTHPHLNVTKSNRSVVGLLLPRMTLAKRSLA